MFKLLTYDEATTPVMAETLIREQEHQHQQHQQQKVMGEHHDHEWAESDGLEHLDDALASSIRDQQAQFADLHDRLQTLSHNLDKVFVDMTKHRSHILSRVDSLNGPLAKTQQLTALENRLHELEQRLEQKIDQKFEQLRGEQKDWSGHFQTLENSLSTRHDALIASMPESMGQGEVYVFRRDTPLICCSSHCQGPEHEVVLGSICVAPDHTGAGVHCVQAKTPKPSSEISLEGGKSEGDGSGQRVTFVSFIEGSASIA